MFKSEPEEPYRRVRLEEECVGSRVGSAGSNRTQKNSHGRKILKVLRRKYVNYVFYPSEVGGHADFSAEDKTIDHLVDTKSHCTGEMRIQVASTIPDRNGEHGVSRKGSDSRQFLPFIP